MESHNSNIKYMAQRFLLCNTSSSCLRYAIYKNVFLIYQILFFGCWIVSKYYTLFFYWQGKNEFLDGVSKIGDPGLMFTIYFPIIFAFNSRVGIKFIGTVILCEWMNQVKFCFHAPLCFSLSIKHLIIFLHYFYTFRFRFSNGCSVASDHIGGSRNHQISDISRVLS